MNIHLKKHGPKEVELSLLYPLEPPRNRRWLECDFYLFTPAKLSRRVAPEAALATLVRHNFYQGYRMEWDQLSDPANGLSPLTRLRRFSKSDAVRDGRVIFELKNLTNQLSQLIGQHRRSFSGDGELFAQLSLERYDQLSSVQHTVDQLAQHFCHREVLAHHFSLALEDLSYLVERFLLQSFCLLERRCQWVHLGLQDRIREQQHNRDRYGFLQCGDDARTNESYLFRLHQLKKWRSSAFYLTVARSRRLAMLNEFLLVGATAAAMAIFLFFSLMGLRLPQWSTGWILVIWVGYVLRDRLKEWMGRGFRRSASSIIGHQFHLIIDPRTGRTCGRIREYVRYPQLRDLPEDIRTLRQLHKPVGGESAERIFHYHEKLVFNSRRFLSLHRRLSGAGQVLRLNLSRYFEHLECGYKNLWQLGPEGVERLRVARRYHFNVLVKVRDDLGQSVLMRYRLLIRHGQLDEVERVYPAEVVVRHQAGGVKV